MRREESVVTVVGIGADGWAGPADASRAALRAAGVLVGGPRQLALLPEGECGGERVHWPSPLRPAVPGLLAAHEGRRVVPGDDWRPVASLTEAVQAVPRLGDRVFLSVGRGGTATKDSGGAATAAKLTAAREAGLPVVLVRRPPAPPGVPVAAHVPAALDRPADRVAS